MRTTGILLGAALVLSGCTSVQWTDDDGVTHHLGLLAFRVTEEGDGGRVETLTLGADLRLSGPTRGYGLGARRTVVYASPGIPVIPEGGLGDSVSRFLAGEEPRPEGESWIGLFYFTEPWTSRTVLLDEMTAGLDLSRREEEWGLDAGYASTVRLVGRAREGNAVLVRVTRRDDRSVDELAFWTLPQWPGEPGGEW